MKKILLTIGLMLSTTFGVAGTIRPSVPDSKYLAFGSKFTCVQPLEIDYGLIEEKKKLLGYASCVILSDEWLITSAHIIEKRTKSVHLIYKNHRYFIEKMLIHKDADTATKFTDRNLSDIALCKLSEKLKDFDKAIMVDEDVKVLGKVVSLCGYGNTGNFNTGVNINKWDLKKRAGTNIISSINHDILLAETTKSEKTTSLEMLVAGGDSGGGVFMDGKLLGIICFIRSQDKKCSDYGDVNGFIDLRKYKGWVNDIIKE